MNDLAKLLVLFGAIITCLGIVLLFFPKLPFLGKLPGDIYIQKENFSFYFPLATSLLLSILLTIIFHFFLAGKK